ncbi:hypothetical protein Syun_021371 [Stephania yunnanensis]|uniref:Uncharacterized protein n=1 Tax=Stephania yunnanensis TaxID=152371 RepID=A0AAP0IFI3_9MAGN
MRPVFQSPPSYPEKKNLSSPFFSLVKSPTRISIHFLSRQVLHVHLALALLPVRLLHI